MNILNSYGMSKNFWEHYTIERFSRNNVNNIIPSITLIEKEFIHNLKNKKVFHPFCNFGMNSFMLEKQGGVVTALDYNKYSIELANLYKQKINSNITFICDDFFNHEPIELYDVIYASYGVLDWIEDIDLFLKKIYSLLNTTGQFIFIEYHSDLFLHKINDLGGTLDNNNQYKIVTGYTNTINGSTKSILGGEHRNTEPVYMKPYLHNTDDFINSLNGNGFNIERLEFYNYINFKLGNDIQLGPKKYRHVHLSKNDIMCFGLCANK